MYDPARHEALTDTAWDEARASAAIEVIAADVDASFDERALWPKHPLDQGMPGAGGYKSLYHGAARRVTSGERRRRTARQGPIRY